MSSKLLKTSSPRSSRMSLFRYFVSATTLFESNFRNGNLPVNLSDIIWKTLIVISSGWHVNVLVSSKMLNLYTQTRWGEQIPEGPHYGNLEESASHHCLLLRGSAPKSSRIVPEKPRDEPKIAENIISQIFENVTVSTFCQCNNTCWFFFRNGNLPVNLSDII